MEKTSLPEMPNEFDPNGHIAGYGAAKTQIKILDKLPGVSEGRKIIIKGLREL